MSVNTDLPLRGGIGKYATHILRTPPAAHGLGGAAPGARADEGDGGAGDAYGVAPGDVDPEQREDLCGGRVRGLCESSQTWSAAVPGRSGGGRT